ncbi:cob(I)yrinic acid a,c-diamide adenosyltransferase [Methylocystis sp. MJC1]|uniref:cob(I)yrinic acid a,c-diamide adenosyltransferase n=1 Tax=Methylocystis sp. MJC1 TaxID=2654282 RepID=UPI0013EA0197|nr:cob(I)yrinic acid a,c-diamide adenosyltransferase [Methylocystis sp. MJC1]KAF2989697.1 Cob(I)yrinic acid a,c-diamide adenosyltransferase [Methylocystis sp. MJC1]MBU6525595.1 cob(I)yrinic acid a,c-diamide adenosyltransferase [Methylocystis sp. MJC1]UZX12071.1 cob(I)yrinic acid a,c-diamide adenosyltransferase [Methylocystis sp. MJC1]
MVKLDRIYTRGGDKGATSLATGARCRKDDIRVEAYGAIDETNAAIGVARLAVADAALDAMLERIQNDLFDLGAELATPHDPAKPIDPSMRLVILPSQVERLEKEIDALNADLAPLRSFVLPAGTPVAAHLHLARTICRRAERVMVTLMQTEGEELSATALAYVNRLSDFLFVASRSANREKGDVLWKPGATR